MAKCSMLDTMARRSTSSLLTFVVFIILSIGFTYIRTHQHVAPTPVPTNSNQSAPVVPEAATASCHMRGVLPDPTCTPGAVDPSVTQANINQTICTSGYTKTVRPSVSYTDNLKQQQMTAYGFSDNISSHEEDHLISLELGGSPTDPHNLWPEPGNSPNPKDKVEDALHTAVCDGHISLHDAQTRIATNWTTAENGL